MGNFTKKTNITSRATHVEEALQVPVWSITYERNDDSLFIPIMMASRNGNDTTNV